MFEPAPSEDAPAMEAPLPEQPAPAPKDNPPENVTNFPTAEAIPDESPFAKGPPKPEYVDLHEAGQEQRQSPEQEPKTAEQPEPVEQKAQPRPKPPEELNRPLTGQTAVPGLPSEYKGPDADGFRRSVFLLELSAIRQRARRLLPEFKMPAKLRSKS